MSVEEIKERVNKINDILEDDFDKLNKLENVEEANLIKHKIINTLLNAFGLSIFRIKLIFKLTQDPGDADEFQDHFLSTVAFRLKEIIDGNEEMLQDRLAIFMNNKKRTI